jgi:hypothetical protein
MCQHLLLGLSISRLAQRFVVRSLIGMAFVVVCTSMAMCIPSGLKCSIDATVIWIIVSMLIANQRTA